jgi:hypothetical protein
MIRQHFPVPKSQYSEAELSDFVGSCLVVSPKLNRMLLAVKLDNKSLLDAAKVYDVVANRVLSAKLPVTKLSSAQSRPQHSLGISRRMPHRAAARKSFCVDNSRSWLLGRHSTQSPL